MEQSIHDLKTDTNMNNCYCTKEEGPLFNDYCIAVSHKKTIDEILLNINECPQCLENLYLLAREYFTKLEKEIMSARAKDVWAKRKQKNCSC